MVYHELGIDEHCTNESCSVMCAGEGFEYLWADGKTYKSPIKVREAESLLCDRLSTRLTTSWMTITLQVSAPEYISLLFNWIDEQIKDPSTFPSVEDEKPQYNANFKNTISVIVKRLFRVYAHIYCSHWSDVINLQAEAHVNTCFKHFVLFSQEFKLIASKELVPLKNVIDQINLRGWMNM